MLTSLILLSEIEADRSLAWITDDLALCTHTCIASRTMLSSLLARVANTTVSNFWTIASSRIHRGQLPALVERTYKPKRAGLSGSIVRAVRSVAIMSAIIRPTAGLRQIPKVPNPAAMYTLSHSDSRPRIGTESGV